MQLCEYDWLVLLFSTESLTFATLITTIVIACYSIRNSNKIAENSVVPAVMSFHDLPGPASDTGGLKISNNGLGPAVINEINFLVGGEKVDGKGEALYKRLLMKIDDSIELKEFEVLQPDFIIGPGQEHVLFSYKVDKNVAERMDDLVGAVQVEIRYSDIYGKKFNRIDPPEISEA